MKKKTEEVIHQSFSFSALVSKIDAPLLQHVVYVPETISAKLPETTLRTKGKINTTDFNLAIQYRKKGPRFFSMSAMMMRKAKVKSNEMVNISFKLMDNDFVEIPEELEAVLEQDEEAKTIWDTFSAAWKRGFAHYVSSVKSTDSRIKRAIEIMDKAKRGTLNAQIEKRKRENGG